MVLFLLDEDNELSIRVHFDNYSSLWDEWYNQADFVKGQMIDLLSCC